MNECKWMIDVLIDMAAFAEKNGLTNSYESLVDSVIEVMIEVGPIECLGENSMVSLDQPKGNVFAFPAR